jgi:hypothetical protein
VLQPLINEIGEKERAVKEVANMANMEQIKGMNNPFVLQDATSRYMLLDRLTSQAAPRNYIRQADT